jgi:hypothetical protein
VIIDMHMMMILIRISVRKVHEEQKNRPVFLLRGEGEYGDSEATVSYYL